MDEVQDKLQQLRSTILGDLKPLVESAGFSPEQKFNLLLAASKASGQEADYVAAYTAAQAIEDPTVKADALLELLEEIDIRLGEIDFSVQGEQSDIQSDTTVATS